MVQLLFFNSAARRPAAVGAAPVVLRLPGDLRQRELLDVLHNGKRPGRLQAVGPAQQARQAVVARVLRVL